jgi:hypothetical protein
MSGRRATWICAELTVETERRLSAAGDDADRESLRRLFWPLSRQQAKAQKRLRLAQEWYEFALADAERSAVACAPAVDTWQPWWHPGMRWRCGNTATRDR